MTGFLCPPVGGYNLGICPFLYLYRDCLHDFYANITEVNDTQFSRYDSKI